MWIEVLGPHYQAIRADKIESVKVWRNSNAPMNERYEVRAVIEDREYVVVTFSSAAEAQTGATELCRNLD